VSTIFSDNFAGTPGTTLPAYDSNYTLIPTYTTPGKTNGSAVYPSVFGNAGYYYAGVTPPSADYSVAMDVVIMSGSGPLLGGPCGRVSSSAATMYHGQYNSSVGAWRLWRQVGGTFTQLGSDVSDALGPGTYNCKLQMVGTTISLYVKGGSSPIISVTDLLISGAGFIGLRIGQSAGSTGGTTGIAIGNLVAATIPSGGTLKTVNSLAKASIKTAMALAFSSVKTYNGLTP
jgi:hypothetical protein